MTELPRDMTTPLGYHYLAEYYGCNASDLDNSSYLEEVMLEAAARAKVTIIKPIFHKFAPQGVTGVIVVAESHFSIHTWPEHGYAAVDLFSCNDFAYGEILHYLGEMLGATRQKVSLVERGFVSEEEAPGKNLTILSLGRDGVQEG